MLLDSISLDSGALVERRGDVVGATRPTEGKKGTVCMPSKAVRGRSTVVVQTVFTIVEVVH